MITGARPEISSRPLDLASKTDRKTQTSNATESFADKIFGQKSDVKSAVKSDAKEHPAHKLSRRSSDESSDSQDSKPNLGRDLKRRLPEKEEKSDKDSRGGAMAQMQSRPDAPRSKSDSTTSNRPEETPISRISQPTSKITLQRQTEASAGSEEGEAKTEGSGEMSPERAEILSSLKQENTEVKEQAMSDFMAKMQSDLGIPPEKILNAFAKMDQKSLEAPPEESKAQFLQNLELKPEQTALAGDLYGQMVNKTGEASLNEKLIGIETGVNLKVISPREDALRQLNEALDQVNNSFFMRGQMPVKGQLDADKMQAQLAALQLAKGIKGEDDQSDETSADALALAGLGAGVAADGSTEAGAATTNTMAAQLAAMNANTAKLGTGLEDAESSTGSLGGRAGRMGKMDRHSGAAKSASETSANADGNGFAAQMKTESLTPMPVAGTPTSGAEAAAGGSQVAGSTAASVAAPAAALGPAGMLVEKRPPTSEEEQANVKELIRQAQFVLKKGGGEMSMQLKPEGMGQVKLKVSVEDGQVNVQMLTDSDAAKHLLEKGFHELKADLVAHQLKVDSMKVAVGTEIQKHMDPNQDHAREQARQAAGDFMGQFREDREGFRQGMFDGKGIRTYNRNQGRPNIAAATTAAASAERRKVDSKRLDLVA